MRRVVVKVVEYLHEISNATVNDIKNHCNISDKSKMNSILYEQTPERGGMLLTRTSNNKRLPVWNLSSHVRSKLDAGLESADLNQMFCANGHLITMKGGRRSCFRDGCSTGKNKIIYVEFGNSVQTLRDFVNSGVFTDNEIESAVFWGLNGKKFLTFYGLPHSPERKFQISNARNS